MAGKKARREKRQRKKENKKKSKAALKEWQKNRQIHEFSDYLRNDLPKSERWFLALFKKENLGIYLDSNHVVGYYIPDFVYGRIIIEIDDPTHETEKQKAIDKKKDAFYKKRGFKVIRIVAWCQTSYNLGIKKLKQYLNEMRNQRKIKPTTDTQKLKKEREDNKRRQLKSQKKGRCQICKKKPHSTIIKYKGKSFKVCLECEKKHDEAMELINKD
jgi:very-short-patch-repair endonuclease